MSTPRETSTARASFLVEKDTDLPRVVAQDLEAIFPLPAPQRLERRRLGRLGLRGVRAARRDSRVALIGMVIAVAFIGLSAGALLARSMASHTPARSERVEVLRIAGATKEPALPSPGPLPSGSLLVANPPTAARVVQAAATPAASKAPKVAARRPAADRRQNSQSTCKGSSCASSVLAADARLRSAYAAAIRAGVSHDVLLAYRDEWAGLQRRASRQPQEVMSRYDEMAEDLDRVAKGRQPANMARRPAKPRSLGAQFAALFR